jgi:hypothetical protein
LDESPTSSSSSSSSSPLVNESQRSGDVALDAAGKARFMYRFTIHSFRDRYGTTAADEWGYSERQLLEQGSWADAETVRKFYLGTTDATYQTVRDLHNKGSKASNRRKAS